MTKDKKLLGERLQKVLANAGFGSRRELERRIEAGEVEVNGKVAHLGDRMVPEDRIFICRRPVGTARLQPVAQKVIIYNKPEGEVVTRDDPEGRPTVFRRLPRLKTGRWVSVGRLDINTSGLLLFTTDGQLANKLMHPSQQIEREYAVRVFGEVTEEMLQQMVDGMELEDGHARFEEIVASGGEGINRWFHIVIMEGRKREVRRLWEAVGAKVNRLKRVRYGPIILDSSLSIGRSRELTSEELDLLLAVVGEKKAKRQRQPVSRAKPRKAVKQRKHIHESPESGKPRRTGRGKWPDKT